MGAYSFHDATGLLSEVDDDLLVRANRWLQEVLRADDALAAGSYCLLETTQQVRFKPGITHGMSSSSLGSRRQHSTRQVMLVRRLGLIPVESMCCSSALAIRQSMPI